MEQREPSGRRKLIRARRTESANEGRKPGIRARRGPRAWLTAVGVLLPIVLTSLLCFVPFYALALIRLLVPWRPLRRICIHLLLAIARLWGFVVRDVLRAMLPTRFRIAGVARLGRHEWYLIIANHQSWVDILVLFIALHGKVPFFRFFMKRELLWLPFFGIALWALDFPAMRRYSREHLERHPEDRGRDLDTVRRACEKFQRAPVTLVNFVEGTRFSEEKRVEQESPYRALLRPKSGGLALVLAAMGERLSAILDVTIAYPASGVDFWRFVSGQIPWIEVDVDRVDPPSRLTSRSDGDSPEYRDAVRAWIQERWSRKDALMQHNREGEVGEPSSLQPAGPGRIQPPIEH